MSETAGPSPCFKAPPTVTAFFTSTHAGKPQPVSLDILDEAVTIINCTNLCTLYF